MNIFKVFPTNSIDTEGTSLQFEETLKYKINKGNLDDFIAFI